jgi:hypothetical protein
MKNTNFKSIFCCDHGFGWFLFVQVGAQYHFAVL